MLKDKKKYYIFCVIAALIVVILLGFYYVKVSSNKIKIKGETFFVGDDYYYTIKKDTNTITLNRFINSEQKNIIMPDTINGCVVDTIGTIAGEPNLYMPTRLGAFEGNTQIETVYIPDSIVNVEKQAFENSSVKTVTIAGNIEEMAIRMFHECKRLESVYFKNKGKIIASYTFSGCISLTTVELPENVEQIESYAFSRCSSLKKLYLPNSVTYIDDTAFNECKELTFYGEKDSYAEQFANEHGIPFVYQPNV